MKRSNVKSELQLKITTVSLSFLFSLILAEVVLRVCGIPHFHRAHTSPPQFQFMQDDKTGRLFYVSRISSSIVYEYDSNPRGYFEKGNTVGHPTNSFGFRGGNFIKEKPARTLRVLFLGDSFTFGEGVRFEDTLGEQTREFLSEKFADKNIQIETYNMGVGGYNTSDELFLLKKVSFEFNPDYIILVYNLNDAEPPLFEISPEGKPLRRHREAEISEGLDEQRPPEEGVFSFHLAQIAWRLFTTKDSSEKTEAYYKGLYRDEAEGWINTSESIKQIAAACQKKKVPVLMALYPILYRLDDTHPFLPLYEKVIQTAKCAGMETLPLLPAFKGKQGPSLWVHPTDQHPNEIAHKIAAKELVTGLLLNKDFLEVVKDIK